MKSQRKQPDQASRRRGQSPRLAQTQRQRSPFQIAVHGKAAGPSGQTAHATGNGLLHLARYGQNDPSIALSRKNSLFCGSDEGGENWACLASLIETCKLNSVNPLTYITDLLTRLVNGWPQERIDELMPWHWVPPKPN
jgi:hypothetical protein